MSATTTKVHAIHINLLKIPQVLLHVNECMRVIASVHREREK